MNTQFWGRRFPSDSSSVKIRVIRGRNESKYFNSFVGLRRNPVAGLGRAMARVIAPCSLDHVDFKSEI